MDYKRIFQKKALFEAKRHLIPPEVLEKYEKDFEIEYAHHSTAIEGNTLTLIQTKVILEDGLSVGGKTLREIYEVTNHNKAFHFVRRCVEDGKPLDEGLMKDIHALLMENILVGGVYRNVEVRITGAGFKPPVPSEMFRQIKDFFAALPYRTGLNPIELAAWTHAEFVRIHPFADGNGRTARMLLNYQLMAHAFIPISIRKENRLAYYEALESFAVQGDLTPFADMAAALVEEKYDELLRMVPEE